MLQYIYSDLRFRWVKSVTVLQFNSTIQSCQIVDSTFTQIYDPNELKCYSTFTQIYVLNELKCYSTPT